MLRSIIRHEWKVLRADRTLHALIALLVGTAAFAAYVGHDSVRRQRGTIARAAADEAARLRGIEDELLVIQNGGRPASPFSDPRMPSTVSSRGGRTVSLAPDALAGLAVGQSDLLPYYYRISHNTNARSFMANGELENPHNLLAGRFDMAFVIIYLLPLFILAVTFNLIAGEREEGTLALALSQPVSLLELVKGKVAARGVVVLGLSCVLTLVVGLVSGWQPLDWQSIVRLAAVFLVIACYAAFWFALAVLVNGLGRNSEFNAAVLAALWLALVVVVPALVQLAAVALHPAPSRVRLVGHAREASASAAKERSRLLARYYEDHPEMVGGGAADAGNFAALGYVTGEEVNRQMQPALDRFDRQLARQHSLVQRYRFLSPAILANEAISDLAGSGRARFTEFKSQAAQFTEEWKRYFVPRLLRADTMRPGATAGLPEFRFREESFAAIGARTALPVLALGLLATGVGLAALRSVRRYRMTA